MRLLPLLLLVVCCSVRAEWESFTVTDSALHSRDPKTLLKKGDLREIWILMDFIERKKDGELSARLYEEFDCKRRLMRTLFISTHSKNRAEGETLFQYNNKNLDWTPIPPNTPSMNTLEYVCSK